MAKNSTILLYLEVNSRCTYHPHAAAAAGAPSLRGSLTATTSPESSLYRTACRGRAARACAAALMRQPQRPAPPTRTTAAHPALCLLTCVTAPQAVLVVFWPRAASSCTAAATPAVSTHHLLSSTPLHSTPLHSASPPAHRRRRGRFRPPAHAGLHRRELEGDSSHVPVLDIPAPRGRYSVPHQQAPGLPFM